MHGGHGGHGCHVGQDGPGGHCDGDRLETIYCRQVAKSDPAAVRH